MTSRRYTSVHTCEDCGFVSSDETLVRNHSCDIQEQGGQCEDYPCCGHEQGDCNGLKYGSDEAIKARVYQLMEDDPIGYEMGDYDDH